MCVREGVDSIVCVNNPAYSVPVWLNSANERRLWLGLANTVLVRAKPFNTHTNTHSNPQPKDGGGGGIVGLVKTGECVDKRGEEKEKEKMTQDATSSKDDKLQLQ